MAAQRVFRGLRVLLPEWRVAMVRPSKPLPPNEALFRVDMRMNKREIREYLQAIYKVDVQRVNTQIVLGESRVVRAPRRLLMKKRDYKLAYVTMGQDYEFPDIFPKKDVEAAEEKPAASTAAQARPLEIEGVERIPEKGGNEGRTPPRT